MRLEIQYILIVFMIMVQMPSINLFVKKLLDVTSMPTQCSIESNQQKEPILSLLMFDFGVSIVIII